MNKKIFIIALFFIFSSEPVFTANTEIIINEINATPTSTHEWIEIFNKGSSAVDLTGWKFWENNTNHGLTASGTDNIINPGEYAAICQDLNVFLADHANFLGSIFDSAWDSLSLGGEEIGLKDSEGNTVENFTYLSISENSLERADPTLNDYTNLNWEEHLTGNTLGAQNSNYKIITVTTTPPTVTSTNFWPYIKINEVVSNPESGNEWVEFFNSEATAADLSGGTVCDNRGSTSTCHALNGNIPANGWLLFDIGSSSYFNNDGDSIILRGDDETIIDQIAYGKNLTTEKGQSLARRMDGVDTDTDSDWAITNTLTPGTINIINEPIEEENSSGGGGANYVPPITTPTTQRATTTTKTPVSTVKTMKVAPAWEVICPPQAEPNEIIVCDASGSADPRGGRLNFSWEITSSTIIYGPKAGITFSTSGTYYVSLSASSTAGTVGTKKLTFFVGPGLSLASGVHLSEIYADPLGAEKSEFIELCGGIATTTISRWKIAIGESEYVIPDNTVIPAFGRLVFARAVTHLTLTNTGATIRLLSPDDNVISTVKYTEAPTGASYSLTENGWKWQSPTPFEENFIFTTSTTSTAGLAPPETKETAKKTTTVKTASSKTSNRVVATNIETARQAPLNSTAILTGIVSVLPGTLGTQFFYIATENSGIQIYQYKKLFPRLKLGDKIEVRGVLSQASGIQRVRITGPKDIKIISSGNPIPTINIAPSELEEALLGALIKVKGEITEIKTNYFYLDDGDGETTIYLKRGANIKKQEFKEGESVEVVGVLEQNKTGLQIWPRGQTDLISLGLSEEALQKQQTTQPITEKDTAEKYLTATAGGLTTLLLGFLARARGAVIRGTVKKAALLAVGLIRKNKA